MRSGRRITRVLWNVVHASKTSTRSFLSPNRDKKKHCLESLFFSPAICPVDPNTNRGVHRNVAPGSNTVAPERVKRGALAPVPGVTQQRPTAPDYVRAVHAVQSEPAARADALAARAVRLFRAVLVDVARRVQGEDLPPLEIIIMQRRRRHPRHAHGQHCRRSHHCGVESVVRAPESFFLVTTTITTHDHRRD